jgi:hypothetical protein
MAEHYLNLYKIQNRKTGQISDFLTDEELKNVLKYFNLRDTIDDYEIFSLNMQNVTHILDLDRIIAE